jgi:hypothetical protein
MRAVLIKRMRWFFLTFDIVSYNIFVNSIFRFMPMLASGIVARLIFS